MIARMRKFGNTLYCCISVATCFFFQLPLKGCMCWEMLFFVHMSSIQSFFFFAILQFWDLRGIQNCTCKSNLSYFVSTNWNKCGFFFLKQFVFVFGFMYDEFKLRKNAGNTKLAIHKSTKIQRIVNWKILFRHKKN